MKHLALLISGFALYTAPLRAQASSGVPESHRPPPGMCRIWIDGVPPTHQPAPTDCATAIRKRPMNARVVFGSETPAASPRNLAPAPRVQPNLAPPSAPPQQDRNVQQQRDEQERQRIEAQQQREEQKKREGNRPPPPPPPQAKPDRERVTPPPRPRTEKAPRPPQQSRSSRRPR